ncbi:MAG: DedA family protein [Prolixibacteraceae bacterium]|jgi:membrane protein DedA with SNARE-associated domain|nr:DedA family protein [Prolixibacteraceae bacterium]
MESIGFIQWCLDNLNYWTITLLMAIESSVIPLPSELVVPPAAYKAAAGELNIYLVVFFSTLGALIGSLINYFLAIFIGRPIVYKFANSRLGHMMLIDEEAVRKTEAFFERNGAISIFTGRLLPGVRHLISIPAGLSRMNLTKFILYTTLGAGIWNIILAAIGYSLESVVPKEMLMTKVMEYSRHLSIAFIILGVLVFGFIIYKALQKSK